MTDTEVVILVVGIMSVILGLMIVVMPRVLPYLVGGYLVVSGVLWIARALL